MKLVNIICLTLTIVGAIVWGIVGIFDINIVDGIFGQGTIFTKLIYTLVGLSGLYLTTFFGFVFSDND